MLDYNTPEKLRSFLDDLLMKGQLPTADGKVARSKIEKGHGFTAGCLSNYHGSPKWIWAKDVVDQFESELIERKGISTGRCSSDYANPVKFEKLINELRKSKNVPIYRGTISRSAFENTYGLPSGSLRQGNKDATWQWARDLVEELEAELYETGVLGTVWERKAPEIREFLEELHALNKLPINALGKLNRREIMSEFGFGSNQSVYIAERRAPKLKELFTEFDQVIAEGTYSQYSGDVFAEKLKFILQREDIVIDKNHRTISKKWLSEELGVTTGIIKKTPSLIALIDSKEKEIHEQQKRGLTKKYFTVYGSPTINLGATPYSRTHNRVFSFKSLIGTYGLEFSEKIGTAFIAISNELASPKAAYGRILHFFEWLADESNGALDVATSLATGKKVNQTRFERACMQYQQDALAKAELGNDRSKGSKPIFNSITKLGKAKVIPLFHFRRLRHRSNKDRSKRPSILEASRKTDFEKMDAILDEAAKYRNIEIEHGKDTKAFIETLVYERQIRDELSDDLVEAMLEISCDRIDELRLKASIAFNAWKSKHQEGCELIRKATYSGSKIAELLEDAQRGKSPESHRSLVNRLFPLQNKELTLSNLLALITARYNGICPSYSTTGSQFWNKQYTKLGGVEEVSSYLLPTRMAVSAALTLYLCESGNNTSVALVLAPDCMGDSEVPGHKRVIGRKDRAKGKPIYDDLSVKSKDSSTISAISALKYLRDSITRITESQNKADRHIAIYSANGKIKILTEFNFRADFKAIANSSSYLKEFALSPSMIRPTVLLEIQLKNPSNLGLAQMLAQHESGTTTAGYTNKLPHRVIQEEHILGYQNTLEVVMTQNVESPHIKIGLSESEWASRYEKAQRTGMGVFCKNGYLDNGKGSKIRCTEIENCAKCKHDRMLISADTRSIAEMIIWKEALDNNEPKWVSERPDRWSGVWVPWKALFSVVLDEKMTRGRLSAVKRKAQEYASIIKKKNGFTMPEPW